MRAARKPPGAFRNREGSGIVAYRSWLTTELYNQYIKSHTANSFITAAQTESDVEIGVWSHQQRDCWQPGIGVVTQSDRL